MNDVEFREKYWPSEDDREFLIRKVVRIYGNNTDIVHIVGFINFKYLGPALVVAMVDKHRDKPQFRFITKNRQNTAISMVSDEYVKKAGRVHPLHDSDVELFALMMAMGTQNSFYDNPWDLAVSGFNRRHHPRYHIKCDQPDYSKLNSR